MLWTLPLLKNRLHNYDIFYKRQVFTCLYFLVLENNFMKYLSNYQKWAIIIPCCTIAAILIRDLVAPFRISTQFHWIYATGNIIGLLLFFISVVASLVNSIFLLKEKIKRQTKIFWVLLSSLPLLYFLILILILTNKT